MIRVAIIGSQHGNEYLGERFYAFAQTQPNVIGLEFDYILANPKARRLGVRYIESDMNRSFTGMANTYEERCAQRLLNTLTIKPYDLVIDAHTTTVDQAPCVIVPDLAGTISVYLRSCHMKHVIVMRHEFVNRSLIGHIPNSLSIEVSRAQLHEYLYKRLYRGLLDFAAGAGHYPQKIVYEVDGLIEKDVLQPAEVSQLKNFQRSSKGFYPVLVGEDSYKRQTNYIGFRASSKKRVALDKVQV